jgi:hypothetical protein
VRGAANARRAT